MLALASAMGETCFTAREAFAHDALRAVCAESHLRSPRQFGKRLKACEGQPIAGLVPAIGDARDGKLWRVYVL